MRLINLTSNLHKRFGLKESIRLIKEYGFDGYDCSLFSAMSPGREFSGDDYLERASEIRKYADELGLPCTQTHTPCPNWRKYSDVTESIDEQIRALEISAVLGAEIAVVHPSAITDCEGNFELLYSKLLPTAKKLGVKIATENMFSWKTVPDADTVPSACGTAADFARYVDYANDPIFTACLDIGHAEMMNTEGAPKIIKALGHERLLALHVHDNDCLHDDHIYPFAGNINWENVCSALGEIDYQGDFTFETDSFATRFPNELVPYLLRLLHDTGRYLISRIEYYKNK